MTDTIKRSALVLAGLAALGFGGAQLANATGGSPSPTRAAQSAADHERDTGDHDIDHDGEAAEVVTGVAAMRARPRRSPDMPGKVTRLSAEHADDRREARDAEQAGDTPEAGDQPDPAYEETIAYDVEVTADDGTITDVALDASFKVLGTEKEGKEGAGE